MEKRNKLAYTLEESAEALHVSRPTMQALVNRADFPAFRVGTRWIIPTDGLKSWLEEQTRLFCEEKATGITIIH